MTSNGAHKTNPALTRFSLLIGEWSIEGSHPLVPGKTLRGRASFEWLYGGAFLSWNSEILDDPRFPSGVVILGSDDAELKYFVLYFDERGVSRKYDVSCEATGLTWWRDDAHFSQRMTLTISQDGNLMTSQGEMNVDGKGWEPDIQLTYARLLPEKDNHHV